MDAGENPPDGVITTYYLQGAPQQEVTLTYLDADENVIKVFSSTRPEGADSEPTEPLIPARAGVNRFQWNL